MKTVAQQLGIKEFPFEIKDKNGKQIYYETISGGWEKRRYDSNGDLTYYENSWGLVIDNRPKPCEGKLVEIDGIKYKLVKA